MGRCSSVTVGRWIGLMMVAAAWCGWATPAAGQEVPFEAVVVGGPAQVRAGAGPAYYLVGELEPGTRVTVREVYYGWNRIDAPQGVYSYITKSAVDANGDGSRGVVNRDGAKVKAASVDGPGPSYRNQVSLNQGAEVAIEAEEGSYYKIRPPQGASVYLPPGAVRRAQLAEQGRQTTQRNVEAEATAVAESAETSARATVETTRRQAASTIEDGSSSPADDDVAIAREVSLNPSETDLSRISPEDMVPAGDEETEIATTVETATAEANETTASADNAPDDAAEAMATAVEAETPADPTDDATTPTPDPADAMADAIESTQPTDSATTQASTDTATPTVQTPAQSAALREVELAQLPRLEQPVEDQPIDEMIAAYEAIDADALPPADQDLLAFRLAVLEQNRQLATVLRGVIDARRGLQTTTVIRPDDARSADDYDAVGRLLASAVYNGNSLPLMFRLVDPATGRTVAYVQPGRVSDARSQLGRVVGVVGPMAYDPVLKLNVVEVREIDALDTSD